MCEWRLEQEPLDGNQQEGRSPLLQPRVPGEHSDLSHARHVQVRGTIPYDTIPYDTTPYYTTH